MISNDAFRRGSACYNVAVGLTPTGPIEFDVANDGDITIYIYNPGPNPIFFADGNTPDDALANAVAPIPGTPQNCIPIGPGSIQTFTYSAKSHFAAVALVAPQNAYFIAGYGL